MQEKGQETTKQRQHEQQTMQAAPDQASMPLRANIQPTFKQHAT